MQPAAVGHWWVSQKNWIRFHLLSSDVDRGVRNVERMTRNIAKFANIGSKKNFKD